MQSTEITLQGCAALYGAKTKNKWKFCHPFFADQMWKQKGHLLLHGDASDAQSVFLVVAVAIRVGKLSKK